MKKINILRKAGFLLFFFFFFFSHLAMAQAVGDFRSIGNGNWAAASSWQIFNGLSWNDATEYPGQTSSSLSSTVTVQGGSTVSFSTPTGTSAIPTAYKFGDLIINGTLNIGDGAVNGDWYVSFPGTQSIIISNGSLFLRSKNGDSNLYLSSEATLFILNGGSIQGDVCNNNKNLYMGTLRYAACTGNGQTYTDFNQMVSSGGSLRAQPTATPQAICGSNGSAVISSANTENNITYQWTLPAAGGWSGATNVNSKALGTISFSQPGQYLFKLKVTTSIKFGKDEYTLIDEQPLIVSVGQTNTVTAASSSPSVCVGTPISNITHGTTVANGINQPGISGANGLPPGIVAYWAQDKITISGTPTVSGIFNYSIPLTGGCGSASATGTITVNTKPAINAMAVTICSGAVFNVTPVNVTNGTVPPVTNYAWSTPAIPAGLSGGAAGSGTSISGTLINSTSGALNAVYTVTPSSGSCGTGNPFTVTVKVNPAPTANAGGALPAICQGGTSSTMGGSTGGGATGGTWSGGTGTWTNANNPLTATYTAGASESGTVTLTLTTSGGSCGTVTATKTITVNPTPSATAGAALAAICQGGTSSTMGGSTGGGATGGTWSGGAGIWTNAGNPSTATYTAGASESGTVTLTLTTIGGSCGAATATKTITVNQKPTVNAGGALAAICQGGTSSAMGGSIGGGATAGSWSGGTGIWTNANNPSTATYTAGASESGTVTLTLTTSGGSCGALTATKTIMVNALAFASVTGNNRICKNTDAVFHLTGTPGATVTYNINGINQTTVVLDVSGNATKTVSSAAVNQTLNIVSVSNGTCTNSAGSSATVTVGEDSVYTTTWSKGLPNGNGLNAVIAGNYNTSYGDIRACSCTILSGGSLTVGADHFLEVDNAVTNNGTLIVESDGNLIQNVDSPSPANSGNITVKRNVKFRNDSRQEYNYLISPVIGQSLKTIYPGVPTTATYPYVLYYNEANNYFYNSSGAYIAGRGLAVKEPTKADVPADNMDAVFNGVPGNGVISFPLAHTNNVQNGYNLVGNPYPSNIDLQKLYLLNGGATASPKISSTFQFWDNGANNIYTQQGSGYNGRAYAVYNAANNTGNAAGYLLSPSQILTAKVPNETAKVGQGFMVRATGGGNLVFNNTIRHGNNAGAGFFSKGTQSPADRYWLKLVTPVNAVNTIAVVYFDGGSNAFGMDDSGMNGDSSDMLYSLAEGNKLQIEGKPMFDVSDKIILGSRHFAAGNYTFALDKAEGVFAIGQHIYLKDKQTGIITNLSEGSYTFAANAGESTGRFEIIYQSETVLATDGTVKDDLLVYRDGDDFVIDSKGKKITQVEVYDSSGRLSLKTEPGSLKTVIPAISLSNGVYILKINQAGKITNRKIIR